jgi:hypothetical protein
MDQSSIYYKSHSSRVLELQKFLYEILKSTTWEVFFSWKINKFAGEDPVICGQTVHPNKVLLSPSPLSKQRQLTIAMLPWRNLCSDSTALAVISYKIFKSKFILTDLLVRDIRHNYHTNLILRVPHYHLIYFGQVAWLQRYWGSILSAVVLNQLQKIKGFKHQYCSPLAICTVMLPYSEGMQ